MDCTWWGHCTRGTFDEVTWQFHELWPHGKSICIFLLLQDAQTRICDTYKDHPHEHSGPCLGSNSGLHSLQLKSIIDTIIKTTELKFSFCICVLFLFKKMLLCDLN